jgi:hypothetical protein
MKNINNFKNQITYLPVISQNFKLNYSETLKLTVHDFFMEESYNKFEFVNQHRLPKNI